LSQHTPHDVRRDTYCAKMFRTPGFPHTYDNVIYHPDSHDTFIWHLQRQRLLQIIRDVSKTTSCIKYFDFACGTGRIISTLEHFVSDAVGLDISSQALAIAESKVSRAVLKCGDIIEQPNIVDYDYDVITAFRFFLNVDAEPELQGRIMSSLASRLRKSSGRLIFNTHGNPYSTYGLGSLCGAARGHKYRASLSYPEVRRLVDQAGLEIESWFGFGICPGRAVTRGNLRPVGRRIDSWAARQPFLRWISRDLLFVSRLKTQRGSTSQ